MKPVTPPQKSADVGREDLALRAALTAALHSLRATAVCKPRPVGLDIQDLRDGMCAIHQGVAAPAVSELCEQLAETRQQRVVAEDDAPASTKAAYAVLKDVIIASGGGQPDLVLHIVPPRASNFEVLATGQKTHWAFHGSAFENVWSIMNTGLVNAAQVSPELAKTGSIFGKGIYLSVEPSYAANFAKTSAPLPEGLGRWRCLFLCEVAPGPMVTIGGASSGSGSNRQGVASRDAHDVPDGVIVVEDSDAVAVRCALMYRRGGDTGGICGATAQFALAALIVIGAIAARTYFEGRGRVYRF